MTLLFSVGGARANLDGAVHFSPAGEERTERISTRFDVLEPELSLCVAKNGNSEWRRGCV